MAAAEFEVLLGGAKGPGKSDLIVNIPLRQVHRPRFKGLVLRETYGELQELIDRMHRYYKRLPSQPVWVAGESRWKFPSGATIEVGYCDRLDHVDRYQGREWGYIGYDEIGKVADQRIWMRLLSEVRSPDPEVRRMMRGSANPGQAGHPWLKQRFVDPCGHDGAKVAWDAYDVNGKTEWLSRRFIPGRVTDNPIYANDPIYMAQLMSLPERMRKHLLYGEWDAASGMALEELDANRHFVPSFTVPPQWMQFGGFDWGFAHPWCFIHVATNEDGRCFVVDTLWGRRQHDDAIAQSIMTRSQAVLERRLRWISCGGDVFQEIRARSNTPSTFERFEEAGLFGCVRASVDRKNGLLNLRKYLAWRGMGPDGSDGIPQLVFMDTPGNRRLFEQLETIVVDEDDPEDARKVDADTDTGRGGDDGYDCLRYAMASRPFAARSTFRDVPLRAFDPAVLTHERERLLRRSGSAQTTQPFHKPHFGDLA